MNWRSLLHAHRDPDWQVVGVHRYYRCRCGARRVTRAYSNLDGTVASGWPELVDRHGMSVFDSGWHRSDVPGRDVVLPTIDSLPPPPQTWGATAGRPRKGTGATDGTT